MSLTRLSRETEHSDVLSRGFEITNFGGIEWPAEEDGGVEGGLVEVGLERTLSPVESFIHTW